MPLPGRYGPPPVPPPEPGPMPAPVPSRDPCPDPHRPRRRTHCPGSRILAPAFRRSPARSRGSADAVTTGATTCGVIGGRGAGGGGSTGFGVACTTGGGGGVTRCGSGFLVVSGFGGGTGLRSFEAVFISALAGGFGIFMPPPPPPPPGPGLTRNTSRVGSMRGGGSFVVAVAPSAASNSKPPKIAACPRPAPAKPARAEPGAAGDARTARGEPPSSALPEGDAPGLRHPGP